MGNVCYIQLLGILNDSLVDTSRFGEIVDLEFYSESTLAILTSTTLFLFGGDVEKEYSVEKGNTVFCNQSRGIVGVVSAKGVCIWFCDDDEEEEEP